MIAKLKEVISENFLYLIFGAIFILGFILGSVFSVDSFDITLLKTGTFADIFISYFSSVSIYLLVIGCSGFSLVGVVTIPLTVFFRGLGLGSAVVSLYMAISDGLSLSSAFVLLPHFVLFALYLIYSASLFSSVSFNLVKLIKYGTNLSDCRCYITLSLRKSAKLIVFVISSGLIYCFSILFLQSII